MKFDEILAAIPKLTPDQRRIVKAAIDSLSDIEPSGSDEILLFTALATVVENKISHALFVKRPSATAWRRDHKQVLTFIKTTWPEANTKTIKLALMRYLFRMLSHNLTKRNIPVTLGTMANNMCTIPKLVDDSFPGYRESGLAHLILRAMTRSK